MGSISPTAIDSVSDNIKVSNDQEEASGQEVKNCGVN